MRLLSVASMAMSRPEAPETSARTELDHDSVTEEEDELLCKLCILLLLPPLSLG